MTSVATTSTGLIPWLLQRVTGLLLVLWVATHFIFWHFGKGGEGPLNYAVVSAQALSRGLPGYLWEMALAGLCLFHGLNGVRNVVYDYVVDKPKVAWLTPLLWAVGVCAFLLIGYHLHLFRAGH